MISNNIRIERVKIGISQEELAIKLDVSRQTINSIENGKTIPSLELAFKISRFFDCTVDEIFKYQ